MTDTESQSQPFLPPTYQTPLLPSDRHLIFENGATIYSTFRARVRAFQASKWGHYTVLLLVSIDVAGIFADFLISLHICEHAHELGFNKKSWQDADDALGVLSLVFSCLFMLELLSSVWAFGFAYFNSRFHIFDAVVIVAGFLVDVLFHGPLEEAGSLVVVGRLWRVFKIIEEFSSGADDQMSGLQQELEALEKENEQVRKENEAIRGENEAIRMENAGLRRRVDGWERLGTAGGAHDHKS
jgi:voltage-gated hydrogen channel 1